MGQCTRGQMVELHKAAENSLPCMARQSHLAIRMMSSTLLLVHMDGGPLTQLQFRSVFWRAITVARVAA